jgi:hypothetical protein
MTRRSGRDRRKPESSLFKIVIAILIASMLVFPSFSNWVFTQGRSLLNQGSQQISKSQTDSKAKKAELSTIKVPKLSLIKDETGFDKQTNSWLGLKPLDSLSDNNAKAKFVWNNETKPVLILHHSALLKSKVSETVRLIEGGVQTSTKAHFGIREGGQIDQFLDLKAASYHVYNSFDSNHFKDNARISVLGNQILVVNNVNLFSYGVEIYYCPRSCPDQSVEEVSTEQIQALAKLMKVLEVTKGITPDRVFFHSEVQPTEHGDRWQEPQYLVFDKTETTEGEVSKSEIKIHPNWYKLITQVRKLGGYKSGKWSKMTDEQLADYILVNNFENARVILDSIQTRTRLEKERLDGYVKILKELKGK